MHEILMSGLSRWMGGAVTGVYQGLIVAGVAWVILRILRRSNAATRHAVAFAAMLAVAVLPVVQGARALRDADGSAFSKVAPAIDALGRGEMDPAEALTGNLASGEVRQDGRATQPWAHALEGAADAMEWTEASGEDSRSEEEEGDEALRGGASGDVGHGGASAAGEGAAQDVLAAAGASTVGTTGARGPRWRERLEGWIRGIRSAFAALEVWDWRLSLPNWSVVAAVVVWGGLAGWRLLRLFRQHAALRRLRDVAIPASEPMHAAFRRVSADLGVRRRPALGVSPGLSSPILVGCRRPAVLVPASFEQGGSAEWTPVFLHELAHVRRGDAWSNLLQQTLAAVYFFHPGVIWLSRRLSAEREIACDDHVLAAQGAPRAYALFLTEHARRMQGPDWVAAPAAWSNPSQLKERIHMLLDNQRNASPRLARMRAGAWTTSVLLVALLAFHAAPRVSVAGAAATPSDPTADSVGTTEAEAGTVVETVDVEGTLVEPVVDVVPDVRVRVDDDVRPKVKVRETRLVGPGGDVLVVRPSAPALELTPAVPSVLALPAPTAMPAPVHVPLAVTPPHPPTPPVPALTVRRDRTMAHLDELKGRRSEDSQEALERRLDRLERLVESVAGERGAKSKDGVTFHWKSDPDPNAPGWNAKDAEKVRERVREIEVRARAQAEDLRKRVEEEVHRAGRQDMEKQRQVAEKMVRDAVKESEKVRREAVQAAEKALAKVREESSPERRTELRRPIEEHRRAIEREMRRMEAQLDQLGSQLEKLEEESERIEELSEEAFERSSESKDRRPEVRVTEERREELPPAKKKEKAPDAVAPAQNPNAPAATPPPVRY